MPDGRARWCSPPMACPKSVPAEAARRQLLYRRRHLPAGLQGPSRGRAPSRGRPHRAADRPCRPSRGDRHDGPAAARRGAAGRDRGRGRGHRGRPIRAGSPTRPRPRCRSTTRRPSSRCCAGASRRSRGRARRTSATPPPTARRAVKAIAAALRRRCWWSARPTRPTRCGWSRWRAQRRLPRAAPGAPRGRDRLGAGWTASPGSASPPAPRRPSCWSRRWSPPAASASPSPSRRSRTPRRPSIFKLPALRLAPSRSPTEWPSTPTSATPSSRPSSPTTTSAEPVSFKGIAEGVENSNYLLPRPSAASYILTLYEKRVDPADLPFFLGLMEHLAGQRHHLPAADPRRATARRCASSAASPPPSSASCEGMWPRRIDGARIAPPLGEALAALHLAGRDFALKRPNALSVAGWRPLFEGCRDGRMRSSPGSSRELAAELDFLEANWPERPAGGRHPCRPVPRQRLLPARPALRPDRLLLRLQRLPAPTTSRSASTPGASSPTTPSTPPRRGAAAGLPQGPAAAAAEDARPCRCWRAAAALRFLLTRLYDWLHHADGRPGEAQGPAGISAQAALPSRASPAPRPTACHERRDRRRRAVEIFTDGACSGNPGPGGWGAILRLGGHERELSGGEPATTNNRMELMAAIAALEALKRPCAVSVSTPTASICATASPSGSTAGSRRGWHTADKKPVKNVDLWQRLDAAAAPHKVDWHWVQGHAGHAENERADALAREGMQPYRSGKPNPPR